MSELIRLPLLFFLQEDLGEVIGLTAVVGFYIAVIVITFIFLWRSFKERHYLNKERLALIERIESLPANAHQLIASLAPAKEHDLRSGIIWLIVGLGVSLTLYTLEDTRSYWPIGLVLIFIGLAYLVSYWVLSRQRRGEDGETEGGSEAPPPRRLASLSPPVLPVSEAPERERIDSSQGG